MFKMYAHTVWMELYYSAYIASGLATDPAPGGAGGSSRRRSPHLRVRGRGRGRGRAPARAQYSAGEEAPPRTTVGAQREHAHRGAAAEPCDPPSCKLDQVPVSGVRFTAPGQVPSESPNQPCRAASLAQGLAMITWCCGWMWLMIGVASMIKPCWLTRGCPSEPLRGS